MNRVSLSCSGCGKPLEDEAFSGPPRRWFHTEGVLSVIAARHGWSDGRCRECSESGPGAEDPA